MSSQFNTVCSNAVIESIKDSMTIKQTIDLKQRCMGMLKLRLYNSINVFRKTPTYLLLSLSFVQKMHLAKLRLCALPLRIEIGSFERPRF